MSRVRLLHWNAQEALLTKGVLMAAGFEVEYHPTFDSRLMRQWREDPPAAFVIDLSRLPSHGREIAIALRQSPRTRHVPIIFCNGAPAKVKRIRDLLPDAAYCKVENLVTTLRNLQPVATPVRPTDMMNRYHSRTSAQKLGIGEGTTVAVINPPGDLNKVLGELPGQVEFVEEDGAVTLCFVHSVDSLRSDMSRVRGLAANTKLWIAWRKMRKEPSSRRHRSQMVLSPSIGGHDGVTEQLVRETGIDLGLVDYKICSINEVWSALLFARRK